MRLIQLLSFPLKHTLVTYGCHKSPKLTINIYRPRCATPTFFFSPKLSYNLLPPKLSYNLLTVWLLLCSKPSRFISRYQYLYLCCVCSVFENRFCSPVLFPVMFGGRGYVHNQQLHDYNCVYLEFRGTIPRPLCIATGPSRLLTGSAQAQRFTVY